MTFWPRRILSTIDSVNSAFRSCLVLSSWKFVQLGACLLEFCLFWESGHMTFCPCRVVSISDSLNSRFCSRLAYSTWDSIYLGVCLLGVCPLESLATWHSAHVHTQKVFQISSGSPLVLSLFESVQLGVYLPGFCTLWSLTTWHSFQVGLCPLLVMWILDSAHVWLCLLGILSNWVFAYLDSVH